MAHDVDKHLIVGRLLPPVRDVAVELAQRVGLSDPLTDKRVYPDRLRNGRRSLGVASVGSVDGKPVGASRFAAHVRRGIYKRWEIFTVIPPYHRHLALAVAQPYPRPALYVALQTVKRLIFFAEDDAVCYHDDGKTSVLNPPFDDNGTPGQRLLVLAARNTEQGKHGRNHHYELAYISFHSETVIVVDRRHDIEDEAEGLVGKLVITYLQPSEQFVVVHGGVIDRHVDAAPPMAAHAEVIAGGKVEARVRTDAPSVVLPELRYDVVVDEIEAFRRRVGSAGRCHHRGPEAPPPRQAEGRHGVQLMDALMRRGILSRVFRARKAPPRPADGIAQPAREAALTLLQHETRPVVRTPAVEKNAPEVIFREEKVEDIAVILQLMAQPLVVDLGREAPHPAAGKGLEEQREIVGILRTAALTGRNPELGGQSDFGETGLEEILMPDGGGKGERRRAQHAERGGDGGVGAEKRAGTGRRAVTAAREHAEAQPGRHLQPAADGQRMDNRRRELHGMEPPLLPGVPHDEPVGLRGLRKDGVDSGVGPDDGPSEGQPRPIAGRADVRREADGDVRLGQLEAVAVGGVPGALLNNGPSGGMAPVDGSHEVAPPQAGICPVAVILIAHAVAAEIGFGRDGVAPVGAEGVCQIVVAEGIAHLLVVDSEPSGIKEIEIGGARRQGQVRLRRQRDAQGAL